MILPQRESRSLPAFFNPAALKAAGLFFWGEDGLQVKQMKCDLVLSEIFNHSMPSPSFLRMSPPTTCFVDSFTIQLVCTWFRAFGYLGWLNQWTWGKRGERVYDDLKGVWW